MEGRGEGSGMDVWSTCRKKLKVPFNIGDNLENVWRLGAVGVSCPWYMYEIYDFHSGLTDL